MGKQNKWTRGVLIGAITLGALFGSKAQAQQTFVEACLSQTRILDSAFSCTMTTLYDNSTMTFTLVKGEKIQVNANGIFGRIKKLIPVLKIQNLPARLVENGIIDHSIRFVAKESSLLATLSIPCGQEDKAALGIIKAETSHLPGEYITACSATESVQPNRIATK
jgi:hypothetical protein